VIRHWLIDLDDTLYPASSGLFAHVARRITGNIARVLGLPEDEARVVQKDYWRRYGTSLRGLMVEHGLDPEPFLADVHDVPVEAILAPDPALRGQLAALPGARHVFTNGPSEFALRVLAHLGVADLFDRVFDIRHAGFVPKPHPEPYRRALAALGEAGPGVALIDDSPQNLAAAHSFGIYTVWLRSPDSHAGGTPGGSVALGAELEPPDRVIDSLAELALSRGDRRAAGRPRGRAAGR
jgi:putative hydrolase of the HAD superfamily